MNPFEILNVSENADDDAILKAYLEQVRLCPPDKNQAQFKKIRWAYETIQDERKRTEYALFHFNEINNMDVLQACLTSTENSQIRFTPQQLETMIFNSLKAHKYE